MLIIIKLGSIYNQNRRTIRWSQRLIELKRIAIQKIVVMKWWLTFPLWEHEFHTKETVRLLKSDLQMNDCDYVVSSDRCGVRSIKWK